MLFVKRVFLAVLFIAAVQSTNAQLLPDSVARILDSIENSFTYRTGAIVLPAGNGILNVPNGFRYLDRDQSIYLLTTLWGNPPDSSSLGMLVPDSIRLLADDSWVFDINYEEIGYVDDDEADDIDYNQLLADIKKEASDANGERVANGYLPVEIVGWAVAPFYNNDKKVLHWAKEIRFGDDSATVLNYNLRILGRKGVYVLNAIASMEQLPLVQSNLGQVVNSIEFGQGSRYADFDPDIDQVAAWTLGGLVAGKVLAKAGFFAVVLKFWKLIALGLAGVGGGLFKYLKRKKDNNNQLPAQNS